MAIEYEFKYKVDYDTLLRINVSFPQMPKVIEMETVYLDTPSGALAARHYTFRRRKENDRYICTLKTPADVEKKEWENAVAEKYNYPYAANYLTGNTRNEWEVECEQIEDAIPQLVAQGAPREFWKLATEGLSGICGAKFTRLARTIQLRNSVVEVDMDSGVLFGGGKSEPFYELEFEVKSGDKLEAGRYIYSIAAEYYLEAEPQSKFARALKLYRGE